ncbi:MAG: hypothetical protein A2X49_07620 [Lentisphaerae bacterium GWF2_52_8]|nr:MAG: hypothetical protein A2X49_07620 [Lentisphaerae bacterium GWF2_52_8]
MKTRNFLKRSLVLSACLAATVFSLSACSKKPALMSAPLAAIPETCVIVGIIDVEAWMKVDGIAKNVRENQSKAGLQQLEEMGVSLLDISKMALGMEPGPKPEGLFLISFSKPVDLKSLIEKAQQRDKSRTLNTENIDGKVLYLATDAKGEAIALVQLEEKLIAAGTPISVRKSLSVIAGKAKSVLSNSPLMALCDNGRRNDMFWLAGLMPKDIAKKLGSNGPDLDSVMICANYRDEQLRIGGIISCRKEEDAKKLTSVGMLASAFISMNPDSGMRPDDFKCSANGLKVNIDITVPKIALDALAAAAKKSQLPAKSVVPPASAGSAAATTPQPKTSAAAPLSPSKPSATAAPAKTGTAKK